MVTALLIFLLPSKLKVFALRMMGHQIGRKVQIGLCIIDVKHLVIGDGVRIGNFNVFKGLRRMTIGTGSTIGRYNVFTCSPFYRAQGADNANVGVVEIGEHTAITMAHYFDAQDTIKIGSRSLVAGLGTILFTHQKGPNSLNETKPITIQDRVYVGAACRIMPGTFLASNIIIGGGSTLAGNYSDEYKLYLSPKASAVADIDRNHPYMTDAYPAGYPTDGM